MKAKLFVLIGVCWISLSAACGQTSITYRFGITSGVTASQIRIPLLSHSTDLLGRYTGGISLEQRFTPAIALIYQVSYTRLGGSSSGGGLSGSTPSITEYNYLILPVLLRIRSKGERGFIEVGGQLGYYLSGRSYTKGHEEQALAQQNVTKLDAGLSGGIGYQLGKHLVLDARYYYGMRKIYADHSGPDPNTGLITFYRPVPEYHRVYSLQLSYYF